MRASIPYSALQKPCKNKCLAVIDSCGVSKIRSAGEQVIGNVGDLSGTLKRLGGVPCNVGNGAGNLFAKILKGRRMGRGGGKDGASNLSARGEIKNFNSRAREGRDNVRRGGLPCSSCFNSRVREGRDFVHLSASALSSRFQFTRPRGARPSFFTNFLQSVSFQFTRPRGARPFQLAYSHAVARFQFTRPQGARRLCRPFCIRGCTFQFTRPQGARRLAEAGDDLDVVVSIHAPARGATLKTLAREN